jgi:undecaprenyl diphosphate synthase
MNIPNELDMNKLPQHIAIIMDGNGRWAKRRGLPRIEGHKAGVESVKDVVEACCELGIKVLTLYSFSKENWQRPKEEVNALWSLLRFYLKKEIKNLIKNNIQLRFIGDPDGIPPLALIISDLPL